MALAAQYVDGKLVTSPNSSDSSKAASNSTSTQSSSNSLDKDAFLQLLVAQMKYQDPMEPASNTEYISQYATFSELEQMQNMSSSLSLSRASGLVGQEVIIETTDSAGKTTTTQGKVEFVTYQSGKAYLSIKGALYKLDDLKQVVDDEYNIGVNTANEILKGLKDLPKVEQLTLSDATNVVNIFNLYDGMTDYQKTLLSDDTIKSIDAYVSKMSELIKAAEEESKKQEADKTEGDKTDDGDTQGDKTDDGDAQGSGETQGA